PHYWPNNSIFRHLHSRVSPSLWPIRLEPTAPPLEPRYRKMESCSTILTPTLCSLRGGTVLESLPAPFRAKDSPLGSPPMADASRSCGPAKSQEAFGRSKLSVRWPPT